MANKFEEVRNLFTNNKPSNNKELVNMSSGGVHVEDPNGVQQGARSAVKGLTEEAWNADQNTLSKEQKRAPVEDNNKNMEELFTRLNTHDNRLAMDPYNDFNHSKGNRRGNLNGLTFESTMNLSRAADALNNKRWWKPGRAGLFTKKYGVDRGEIGNSERWEPISTQEMRQMRQNENVDAYVRQRDANRQANVQDYAQELRRKADDSMFTLTNLLNTNEMTIMQSLREAGIGINVGTVGNAITGMQVTNFTTQLAKRTKNEYLEFLAKFMKNNPDAVNKMASQLMAGIDTFSRSDFVNTDFYKRMLEESGYNPHVATTANNVLKQIIYRNELAQFLR